MQQDLSINLVEKNLENEQLMKWNLQNPGYPLKGFNAGFAFPTLNIANVGSI